MQKSESWDVLTQLADRFRVHFGENAGAQIMTIIYQELGGLRVTIPTITQIAIQERNRRIRAKFTGYNHETLAASWGLSVRQVRRIVNGQ